MQTKYKIFFLSFVAHLSLLGFFIPSAFADVNTGIPGATSVTNPGDFVNAFYKYALWLGGILAFGAVVYGGVKYILAAGNPSGQSEGKDWIKSALLGLLLLGSAYLVLYIVNPNLVNLSLPSLSSVSVSSEAVPGGGTTGVSGSCSPLSSGPASVSNLNATCFNAINNGSNDGSAIAAKESGGDPTRGSTSDKCYEDGNIFSWGLFQINLTVNGCPSAFDHKAKWDSIKHVYHCKVINKPLYDKCVNDVTKSLPNINIACPLASNSRAWDNWSTNCTCNFTPPSPHILKCL